jgi:hypothetical protein
MGQCKVKENHEPYKATTIKHDLLSLSKLLKHITLNCKDVSADRIEKAKSGLQGILGSINYDVERLEK